LDCKRAGKLLVRQVLQLHRERSEEGPLHLPSPMALVFHSNVAVVWIVAKTVPCWRAASAVVLPDYPEETAREQRGQDQGVRRA
jgi:hypothetical protein